MFDYIVEAVVITDKGFVVTLHFDALYAWNAHTGEQVFSTLLIHLIFIFLFSFHYYSLTHTQRVGVFV